MIAGAGGSIGSALRFLAEILGELLCHGSFPLGIFMANMCGCFLIGLFYGWAAKRTFMTKELNVLLITGLCGGFTTFSSFSANMIEMLKQGSVAAFMLYMASSIILGIAFVALGISAVKNKQIAKTLG